MAGSVSVAPSPKRREILGTVCEPNPAVFCKTFTGRDAQEKRLQGPLGRHADSQGTVPGPRSPPAEPDRMDRRIFPPALVRAHPKIDGTDHERSALLGKEQNPTPRPKDGQRPHRKRRDARPVRLWVCHTVP